MKAPDSTLECELAIGILVVLIYPGNSMQILPGRPVKQEQEEVSRNHVHTFSGGPVQSREKVLIRGCEKFLPALAELFCWPCLGAA